MSNIHAPQTEVRRDHITIDLGVPNYYISIVVEESNYYDARELALVKANRPDSLVGFMSYECVPLNKWFDSSQRNEELTIDLTRHDFAGYHLLAGQPEGRVIAEAINRAMNYLNNINTDNN